MLPIDVVVADSFAADTKNEQQRQIVFHPIGKVWIGPKTIALFNEAITKAPQFMEWSMGVFECQFATGTNKLPMLWQIVTYYNYRWW